MHVQIVGKGLYPADWLSNCPYLYCGSVLCAWEAWTRCRATATSVPMCLMQGTQRQPQGNRKISSRNTVRPTDVSSSSFTRSILLCNKAQPCAAEKLVVHDCNAYQTLSRCQQGHEQEECGGDFHASPRISTNASAPCALHPAPSVPSTALIGQGAQPRMPTAATAKRRTQGNCRCSAHTGRLGREPSSCCPLGLLAQHLSLLSLLRT